MHSSGWIAARNLLSAAVVLIFTLGTSSAAQDDGGVQRVNMFLGDYQFHPKTLSIVSGEKAELILTNRDSFVFHNFVIEAPEAGMQIRTDVPAGEPVTIVLQPMRSGTYSFYCDEQFLFFENHREKGMEGQIEVRADSG